MRSPVSTRFYARFTSCCVSRLFCPGECSPFHHPPEQARLFAPLLHPPGGAMSPAALRAQLASIMEVLANAAVAEICELVDGGYSQLQLELTESRRENEALRRRLRLLELRAGRTSSSSSSSASSAVMLRVHHHGNEPRRSQAPGGEAAPSTLSNQEALRRGDADLCSDSGKEATPVTPAAGRAAEPKATVIKEEDNEESWCPSELHEGFGRVADEQVTQTEAPPPLIKQEAPGEGGGSSQSWLSGEVGSTSVPKTLNTSSRDCLMYEPQLQHGSLTTQNPLSEDPGCSYAPSVAAASDSGSGGFPFAVSEVSLSVAERLQPAGFQESQQRAPLPAEEPRLPARKEATQRQNAAIRRDRRAQDGANGASGHGSEGGGGKTFVCNFCGKTLACLKNLKTHMRVHTGEKPFVCTLCGKRFSDSSNLKRHQSVHTGEKRYGCVHCGKRFAQSGSLKVHMTVHTDCKQFRCSFCGKTFISGSHLRRHVTVHARERRFAPTFQ